MFSELCNNVNVVVDSSIVNNNSNLLNNMCEDINHENSMENYDSKDKFVVWFTNISSDDVSVVETSSNAVDYGVIDNNGKVNVYFEEVKLITV